MILHNNNLHIMPVLSAFAQVLYLYSTDVLSVS